MDQQEDESTSRLPRVAVVGRPNVGKSTLVNRILGRRAAITQEKPGVTRDRVTYQADWAGRRFELVDTGGWEPKATGLQASVVAQAERAMADADLVLLVVDATVGVTEEDALELVLSLLGPPRLMELAAEALELYVWDRAGSDN